MKVYDGTQVQEPQEPTPERVKVGIAEYEVAENGAVLTTSGLGSCIGLALYDRERAIGGLVHVMLPASEEMDDGNAAKFADAGTELLIEKMEEAGAAVDALEAKLAGGSDMLDFSENGAGIGDRNADRVIETLEARDVPVVAEDVGGDHGRSVRLETRTGDFLVKSANEGQTTL